MVAYVDDVFSEMQTAAELSMFDMEQNAHCLSPIIWRFAVRIDEAISARAYRSSGATNLRGASECRSLCNCGCSAVKTFALSELHF